MLFFFIVSSIFLYFLGIYSFPEYLLEKFKIILKNENEKDRMSLISPAVMIQSTRKSFLNRARFAKHDYPLTFLVVFFIYRTLISRTIGYAINNFLYHFDAFADQLRFLCRKTLSYPKKLWKLLPHLFSVQLNFLYVTNQIFWFASTSEHLS